MQNSAKPLPSTQSADLMDTIRTDRADGHVQQTNAGTASQQAPSQFAMLQAALGKFSDEQLFAALAQVTDFRLVSVLARRLGPAVSSPAQVQQEVVAEQEKETEQAVDAQADHRSADRAKVLRSGKIIYNNKMSVSDCSLRDISETGCRISMESTAGIPKNFTLHILNGDVRHECEVAWRSSMAMGVKFIG